MPHSIDDLNDPELLRAYRGQREPGFHKFNARDCDEDGFHFDSHLERDAYRYLKLRQQGGEIRDLEVHPKPKYILQDAFDADGEYINAVVHGPDFRFILTETGKTVVADAKGKRMNDWVIRYKLFRKRYPDIAYEVITRKDL